MTTLVGKQIDFQEALYQLCELEYDAKEAYQAALLRLNNLYYKAQLNEFMKDHEHHIDMITQLLKKHDCKIPSGPDLKQFLAQGKVLLGQLAGDEGILKAMLSNEEDTNVAYERLINHPALWSDADPIIQRGLNDEKRHKSWMLANT